MPKLSDPNSRRTARKQLWRNHTFCGDSIVPDTIDEANELAEQHLERSLRAARQPIAVGAPGVCDECGDDSPRLVRGRCAPCRDGRPR